ncbi:hypothetical protein A1O3_00791 [Capronia epimyces CBS 606.96]|uniref:Uncharacterized protein n=1 Tax=Capronia epimyces CBS 606.96 TaxID=1182542 RepID=W9YSJ5_9EURO|nr:uncharacterized protein A1O3_00791 [Capronia epimyces CBS 606.96]EXJ92241.1 hypothetical protein A1O3_00791 [Capronia epimyces CBS 606.96]
MSTAATSLVPSSKGPRHDSALQSARNIVTHEIATTTHFLANKAHDLGLTPSKSTPTKAIRPSTYSPSPGRFRHPRTTEILARSSASALTETNVKGALTNAAVLILSFMFSDAYYSSITPLLKSSGVGDASQLSSTALFLFRLVVCANMVLLLRPVIPYISKKDEITDIPLTPSQRSLLGLDPSVSPTPNSAGSAGSYITPPRYRRSSGSFSGTPGSIQNGNASDRRSISATYSSSPLSTSRQTLGFSATPSQSVRRTASGSPFSPSPTASPLFHKAVNQASQFSDVDFGTSTRSSFGTSSGSGLGRSQSLRDRPRRESLEPSSPTPGTRSPQIVPGLNYKWLYDMGMKLPKSESYGF